MNPAVAPSPHQGCTDPTIAPTWVAHERTGELLHLDLTRAVAGIVLTRLRGWMDGWMDGRDGRGQKRISATHFIIIECHYSSGKMRQHMRICC